MIHDVQVEVTCDGENCTESVYIYPPYVYVNLTGAGGRYDTSDKAIEKRLPAEGWIVRSGHDVTLHYCCEECRR